MNHSICKQYLYVDFNGTETDASALHGKLSAWCRDYLFPALERALDRCAPANEYWLLERLEIDAGTIAIDRLEQDLSALIEQALEKLLRAQLSARTYPESSSIRKSPVHPAETEEAKQQSAHQRLTSALIYFLTTGALPWNVKLPERKNLEQALLQEWQENPSSFDTHSLLPVFSEANVRKRLVRQFSETFLAKLLERIAPAVKQQLTGILQPLKNSGLSPEVVKPLVMQLWETAFEPGRHTPSDLIIRAWQKLSAKDAQHERLASILEQHWPGTTGANPAIGQAKKSAKTPIPGQKPDASADLKTGDSRLPLPAHSESEQPSKAGAPASRPPASQQTKQHPDVDEGIYIDNAGLVILHPFLPQFFSALNIADNDRLIRPERALCLLHFLITGQAVAPEYELVLPKVLCNMPLTAPAESDVALTQIEQEEAEALLQSVIHHWAALKNTGIDGLRGAFLLRAGKIKLRADGDWLLQVENKGYDILLEQLPWGIGAIRLPWMDAMLWVEWA